MKQYILIVVTSLDTCKAEIHIWCNTQKPHSLHKSNAPSFLHPSHKLWQLPTKRKPSRKAHSCARTRTYCRTGPCILDEQRMSKASRRITRYSYLCCTSKENTKPQPFSISISRAFQYLSSSYTGLELESWQLTLRIWIWWLGRYSHR